MKLDFETLERIVKVVAKHNEGVEFSKKYLKIFDDFDLITVDEGESFYIKTVMKNKI